VRKFVYFGLIFVAFLLLALKLADTEGAPAELRTAARATTLPLRVAALYAREPDAQLPVPVAGVSVRRIRNTWRAPRSEGREHQGQDIFARRGTPVLSATEGYVWRVGENRLGGNTVTVVGAGARAYYYAHLDSYAEGLAAGQFVSSGTVLGYVGTTGNAAGTPPHLHFGVYTPQGAIDPLPLLTDRP
jgi:murein DD-endopeptidase MepM/ murein hydrolase activator NlpD